jgi:hypothetical protein
MRGNAQQREHLVRGRGELLWSHRNVADTKARGDPERLVRQLRRGIGATQCAENKVLG